MSQSLLLCIALSLGQAGTGFVELPGSAVPVSRHCSIVWLRPWTADDLQMKPTETVPCCGNLLWCPKKEETNQNANAEKKSNGNGNGKKEGGEEERSKEEPKVPAPLAQALQCFLPGHHERMQKRGDSIYGWIQQGYTANFDSPRDRVNFGT